MNALERYSQSLEHAEQRRKRADKLVKRTSAGEKKIFIGKHNPIIPNGVRPGAFEDKRRIVSLHDGTHHWIGEGNTGELPKNEIKYVIYHHSDYTSKEEPRKVEIEKDPRSQTETHKHHWVLDSNAGKEMVEGTCKYCGSHRDNFRVYTDDLRKYMEYEQT